MKSLLLLALLVPQLALAEQPPLGDTTAYRNLLVYAEENGINVADMDTTCNEEECFTGLASDINVFVSREISPDQRVCVLAHELTHAIVHRGTYITREQADREGRVVASLVCTHLGYTSYDIGTSKGAITSSLLRFASLLSNIAS